MRPSLQLLAATLALALAPTARAVGVPTIAGHLTDPGHELSDHDKSALEDELTHLAEDSHVDVAGWLSDVPPAQAAALGRAFWDRWNIGRDWDGGVFFMFPASGPVQLVQDPRKPELSPPELARLVAVDDPRVGMHARLERLIAMTRALVVPKHRGQARPWGQADPKRGVGYALASAALALAAVALSVRRASSSKPAGPHPS